MINFEKINNYLVSRIFTFLLLIVFTGSFAAVRTSVNSGNWTSNATWDCNCTPGNNDDVVISTGNTVTVNGFFATRRSRGVIVQSGATLDLGILVFLESRGDVEVNGTITGFGFWTLTGNNSFLSGSGTIEPAFGVQIDKTITINAGSSLTFAGGDLTIRSNRSITNLGDVVFESSLVGQNTSSRWINDAGSSLTVYQDLLTQGILEAGSTGNSVRYAGASQDVKNPQGSQYYHLAFSGSGTKSFPGLVLTVLGNIDIASCTIDRLGQNLFVAGNWTNNAGTHLAGAGTVFFNGAGNQTIAHSSAEQFFHLSLDGGGTKILGSNVNVFGNLTINSGLDAGAAGHTINIAGQWVNNGTFNQQTGLVRFNGSSLQNISGPNTFFNITIQNPTGVALQASQNVLATLSLSSGNLNLNGNDLILISNSTRTARIGTITGGSISGDITMQRHVPSGPASWRFLAVPVTGRTYADWMDDVVMTGFTGSQYPNFGWTSVYTYDETVPGIKDFGYLPATAASNAVIPGRGYWVYFGAGVSNLDVKGPVVTGNFNFPPLSYTPSAGGFLHDGWNQVGNPYPSSIDWDAASGWTKTNVDNAIYIWSSQMQQYTAYVFGIGVNGGSRYVPSSQSFWVHANAASPSLACTEQVKSSYDEIFRSTATDYLKLKISSGINSLTDETVVRFHPQATEQNDGGLDALKFYSDNVSAPGLSTVSDSVEFSINSLAWKDSVRTIPVFVTGLNGTYSLSADIDSFAHQNACLVLFDATDSSLTDLRANPVYTFQNDTSWQGPRFIITIYPGPELEVTQPLCAGDSMSTLSFVSGVPLAWQMTNGGGALVASGNSMQDTISLNTFGNYSFNFNGGAGCVSMQEGIEIASPPPIALSYFTSSWDCGDSSGLLTLVPSGGTAPYSVSFNGITGGPFGIDHEDKGQAVVTDQHNCVFSDSIFISYNNFVTADFSYAENGLEVIFNESGSGANSWFWDFGDGNTSALQAPAHTYATEGTYLVTLISSGDSCSSFKSSWINVSSTGTSEEPTAEIEIWYGSGALNFSPEGTGGELEILDIRGLKVFSGRVLRQRVQVTGLADGIYIYRYTRGQEIRSGSFKR